MVLPYWLQLQLQHLLPLCGQRHCCDNPEVPLLCSSSAGVGLEMQVCYLSAASLPVPSPEPPELAAGVSVDVSSLHPSSGACPSIPVLCPSVPALGVLPQPPGVSWWLCVEPGLLWGGCFRDGVDGVLADGLSRGEVGVCAPPLSPCCVWSCTL